MTSQPKAVTRDADVQQAPSTDSRTAAQRQREYRRRLKRAAIDAIGQEVEASRVTLLAMLGRDLAALEAPDTPQTMVRATRNSARRVLSVIVTRYGIEL